MTRRDLIQKIVVGGSIILVTPTILSECTKITTPTPGTNTSPGAGSTGNKITIDLTNPTYAALNTIGGSFIVQGIIVANTGSGNYVALSSICTHQGCTVGYSSAANNFPCPCHGSIFSPSGSVINGPAATSLQSYSISKTGDILTIAL